MKLSIQLTGLDRALGEIRSSAAKLPSRAASMLNTGAFAARKALQDEMAKTFKGGVTPYLRNSLRVNMATPQRLVAEVFVSDFLRVKAGADPEKLLTTMVRGGDRVLKSSERRLRAAGLLQPGFYIVPGEAAVLDSFGNLSGTFMRGLLSYLQAFKDDGYTANTSEKKLKRMKRQDINFFVTQGKLRPSSKGGHLHPGIYQRRGPGGVDINPIIMFVRRPTYQPRLKWHEVANPAALAAIAKAWAAR